MMARRWLRDRPVLVTEAEITAIFEAIERRRSSATAVHSRRCLPPRTTQGIGPSRCSMVSCRWRQSRAERTRRHSPRERVVVRTVADTARVLGYRPPVGVSRLSVFADVNLTNSANGYRACPPEQPGVDAVVRTRLLVWQVGAKGRVCSRRASSGQVLRIDSLTHHAKA